jgi:predicted Rossmann fold nucleotide-binding protein DprA/Smf involved in DNA uptake
MTNKQFFEAVITANMNEELTAHAQKMLDQLTKERAAAAKRVSSKRAEENAPIVEAILSHIKEHPMALTADIAAAIGATTPKVSSLLTALTNEGKVESSDVKIKGKGTRKAWTLTNSEPSEE